MSVSDFVSFHWFVLSQINTRMHSRQQYVGTLFFSFKTHQHYPSISWKTKVMSQIFHSMKLILAMSILIYFSSYFSPSEFAFGASRVVRCCNQSNKIKTGKMEERERGKQKWRRVKGSRGSQCMTTLGTTTVHRSFLFLYKIGIEDLFSFSSFN